MNKWMVAAVGAVFLCFSGMLQTGYGADVIVIDSDLQYDYALSRFKAGAYDEAVAEFHRFIAFFPEDNRVDQAYHTLGMAHFNAGRYRAAASVFRSRTDHYTGSHWQNEAFFMLSRCHARMGMTDQAILDLHTLSMLEPGPTVLSTAWYEMGWLRVDQGRWKDAKTLFSRIDPEQQADFRVPALSELLTRSDAIPAKSPALAGTLSIIPGGGQLYCGRKQDAVVAFLINAGLIWAACEAFDDDQIALGAVISFVEFGFYAGNIYGAISDAHKFNAARSDEFRQSLYHHRKPVISLSPEPGGLSLSLRLEF